MLRTQRKFCLYDLVQSIGSCFFYGEKMKDDIKKAILEFENRNKIAIDNYYCKDRPKDKFALKDNYIGKDIFLKRVNEWLEICSDDAERKYLLELLEEYLYFPQDRFNEEVERIINRLKDEGIDIRKTLFVTFPSKNGVASGGDNISSALLLATMDVSVKENIITDVERATEDLLDRIVEYKYIVFLDDVIGSGTTLNTNIKKFFERFSFPSEVVFYIAYLCGREKKIREKIKQFKKYYKKQFRGVVLFPLKKSLFQNERKDRQQRIEKISNIEKIIEDYAIEDRDKKFYMGFEKNQLLVSFYYNTPNNTLSLFWRPTSISVPLFARTSYKRPTIDECRKNKKKLMENAYERGKTKKWFQ